MKSYILKRILQNNTKIIATLGPASCSKKAIYGLIKEGVDIFRLNFSHGTYNSYIDYIKNIREINKKYGINIPILQDLQGPKIRVDNLEDDSILLKKNQILKILPKKITGNQEQISISYKNLYKFVRLKEKILLDDGKIELKVMNIKNRIISVKVMNSGILKPRKGVNFPNTALPAPCLTQKDKKDIKFALKHKINIFALSFVRKAEDIITLKKYLKRFTNDSVTIIAKIEKPEAVKNIKSIIKEVDGIMVARGDLGVEMSPEKIPLIQKKLINIANQYNKFVITATQMLESMIDNPIPTRAETTDIYNAVIDRTDAVMLSGETTIGKFPIRAVRIMSKILKNAESNLEHEKILLKKNRTSDNRSLIAGSMYYISKSLRSKYIISFTNSGRSAQILSKIKPDSKILTFTPAKRILNRSLFYYGVFPFSIKRFNSTELMLEQAKQFILKHKLLKKGDKVIASLGIPLKDNPGTNTLIIYDI